ncbi:amino acid ABC transporter substrate-binding protein [Pseudoalteromonas sp. 3D05]|nr:amino acid ABC transporter substrate-binding protein [Pseudoalteromonas sp. 3D05]
MLISQGYGVDVEFYPWARAVREAELGKADILFPEYFIDDSAKSDNVPNKTRNEVLALSAPIPGGDLSLITLKDNNIQYDGSLNSIKNEVIGVVRAYKNTIELDKFIDNNQIATIVVNNEFQLARLLLSKRVTLIVADLDSLLASVDKSPMSANQKQIINSSLVALKPSLEYKYLHYSVSKKKANWRSILQAIDSKIETMNKERTFEQQIKESSRRCK